MAIDVVREYFPVLVLTLLGAFFVVFSLFLSRVLRPRRTDGVKLATYECAEVPMGDVRVSYNIQYYLIVIVFLIFDVEVMFLYPWAVHFRELGRLAFFEVLVFVEVLVIALGYAWNKEALEWIR